MTKINNRDRELILRIIDHSTRIQLARKLFGDDYEIFCKDADYRDVINMNIFQMGELANQVSDNTKEKLNHIPWHKMYGIRNIMAHAYIIVDNKTIWDTVIDDIPELTDKLKEYL